MGCYRKGEAENPTVYASAVALVLAEYPDDVVKLVTDPRTGIPGRSKWLPAVSEVREACERAMLPIREEAARRARIAETPRPIDRSNRPSLAELRGRYPQLLAGSKTELGDDY